MKSLKDLKELEINDIFSLTWGNENVVAIVVKKSKKGIVFNDIWSENEILINGTSVIFKKPNEVFKYVKFLFNHIDITPEDVLKVKCPEYFL